MGTSTLRALISRYFVTKKGAKLRQHGCAMCTQALIAGMVFQTIARVILNIIGVLWPNVGIDPIERLWDE